MRLPVRSIVVAEEHPWPTRGGISMRNAANVAALAALGPVTVVGVGDDPIDAVPSPLGEHRAVGLGRRPAPDATDAWAGRAGGHPSDGRWDERTERRWRRILDETRPGVVVVEQLWLHHALAGAGDAGACTVLDAHNVEANVYTAIAASVPATVAARDRRLATLMAKRTEVLEGAVVGGVDQVWACSDSDVAVFREAGADARLVPNAVDTRDLRLRPTAPRPPNLVFSASFAYPPNALAARLLAADILPRFAARVGTATLSLVGRDPPSWLCEWGRRDRAVEVTGAVPTTRPWLERASAMVVPLQEGSGTRFKVLEALALGLPVVSTPKGVEGLDVVPGEHVLVGHHPGELADLAVGVHRADTAGTATAGRALVKERYSWQTVAEAIKEVVGR